MNINKFLIPFTLLIGFYSTALAVRPIDFDPTKSPVYQFYNHTKISNDPYMRAEQLLGENVSQRDLLLYLRTIPDSPSTLITVLSDFLVIERLAQDKTEALVSTHIEELFYYTFYNFNLEDLEAIRLFFYTTKVFIQRNHSIDYIKMLKVVRGSSNNLSEDLRQKVAIDLELLIGDIEKGLFSINSCDSNLSE